MRRERRLCKRQGGREERGGEVALRQGGMEEGREGCVEVRRERWR